MFQQKRKILKVGNGLAVYLPLLFIRKHDLRKGDKLTVEFNEEKIVLKPPKKEEK